MQPTDPTITQPAEGTAPGPGAGDPAALSGTPATDTATVPASPADAQRPATGDDPATPAAAAAPDPTPAATQAAADYTTTTTSSTTSSAPSSVTVGDVVRFATGDDELDAPAQHVLVVGTVQGTDARPEGALVVPLPEARWVPLDELATD